MTSPAQASTARVVLSETLQSGTTYLKSYQYVDGFARPRETQVPSPGGTGRIVEATLYDGRGLVAEEVPGQYNTAAAGSGAWNAALNVVTGYTHYDYDADGGRSGWKHYTNSKAGGGTGGVMVNDRSGSSIDRGDRVEVLPPSGGATVTYYTMGGEVSRVADYIDSVNHRDTVYTYTDRVEGRRVTVSDPEGKVSWQQADLAGRRIASLDANAGEHAYGYDRNGNLTRVEERPTGAVTTTSYDELDRPRSKTVLAGTSAAYTAAAWTYDLPGAFGRVASATATTRSVLPAAAGGTIDYTTTKQVTGYDGRYRPTGMTTTLPSHPSLGGLSGKVYSESYGYDAADHLKSVTHPVNSANGGLPGETVTVNYTDQGRVDRLSVGAPGGAGSPVVSGTTYTGDGFVDVRSWVSGVKQRTVWDQGWRLPLETQTFHTPSGGGDVFWQRDRFTRDVSGNLRAVQDLTQGASGGAGGGVGQAECFAYDGRQRLTRAWTTSTRSGGSGWDAGSGCQVPADSSTGWNTGVAPYSVRYRYSPSHRIEVAGVASIGGGGGSVWTDRVYSYGDAARPAGVTGISNTILSGGGGSVFSFDGRGRMVSRTVPAGGGGSGSSSSTLGWDSLSRLTASIVTGGAGVGGWHRFVYDADGQRVVTVSGSAVSGSSPTVVSGYVGVTEVTASGVGAVSLSGSRRYTMGGVAVAVRSGGGPLTYLVSDVQGSMSLSIGSGVPGSAVVRRQRYMPYGAVRGGSVAGAAGLVGAGGGLFWDCVFMAWRKQLRKWMVGLF